MVAHTSEGISFCEQPTRLPDTFFAGLAYFKHRAQWSNHFIELTARDLCVQCTNNSNLLIGYAVLKHSVYSVSINYKFRN